MGRFFAVVNDPHYDEVNTHLTFAHYTCPHWLVSILFKASRHPVFGILSFAGTLCGYLSFVGVMPYIGLGALGILPAIFLAILFSNVYIARCLTRTFTFWLIILFNTTFLVCGADMTFYDPTRVFALVCYWLSNIALVLFDARLYGKHKSNLYRVMTMFFFAMNAMFGIVAGFLYVFGILHIRHSYIPLVSDVSFPVSTAGMSALQAIVTYQCKCVWTLFYSPDINPLLILQARISYHLVPEQEGDVFAAEEIPVQHRRGVQSMRVTEIPMPTTLEDAQQEIAELRIRIHGLVLSVATANNTLKRDDNPHGVSPSTI